MAKHLSISLLLLLLSLFTKAQTYHYIPYNITSSMTIGGNTVTVTETTLGNGTSGGHCVISGPEYHMGNPNGEGFIFNFSLPISHIRLRIVAIDSAELISIKINGTPYTLNKNEISPISPSLGITCNSQTADSVVNGELTTFSNVTNGKSAQIDLNPGYQINNFEVRHTQISGSSGSIHLVYFVNDTCYTNNYSITASTNDPCEGDTLKLFATHNIPNVDSFKWYSGISLISTSQNAFISNSTQANSGSYIVMAYRGKCTYSSFVNATVKPRPVVSNATNNTEPPGGPICPGQTIQLSADPVSGATQYSWTGPGSYSYSSATPAATRTNTTSQHAGDYYVTVTVNGCTSAKPDTTTVTMTSPIPTPTASNQGPNPVCPGTGNHVTLSATSSVSNPTFIWSGPNGFNKTGSPVQVLNTTFADSGWYYVYVTSSGCNSLSDSVKVNVVISTPTPNITPDTMTVCPGTPLGLYANTIPGTGNTYKWTGPSYSSAQLSVPTTTVTNNATLAHGGKYFITATKNNCTSFPDSVQVVIDITTPTPDADSHIIVCPGTTLKLKADTIPGATYKWTGPSFTSPLQNPTIPNVIMAHGGKYFVTATLNGCVSRPDSTIVIVDITTPTPKAGSNSPACPNTELELTASDITGATYSWTGPSFSSSQQNPVIPAINYGHAGRYFVTATVDGCVSRPDSVDVLVEITTPTPDATSNSPICRGDRLTLLSGSITNAIFNWTGPGGFTSTDQNPIIDPTTESDSGLYIVTANVAGCVSNPDTIRVIYKLMPDILTLTSNSPVCEGDSLVFIARGVAHGDSAYYKWTGPNNFTSSPSHYLEIKGASPAATGTYTVTATYDGCTAPARTIDVVVKPMPSIPLASSNSPMDTAKKPGERVKLFGTSATPGVSYSWTGPGGFTSNEQNPVIQHATKASEGEYILYTTLDGCTTSAVTGVGINPRTYYQLYPNPNNGNFTIKASLLHDQIIPVEIMDVSGRVVYRDTAEVKDLLLLKTFSLGGNLSNGMYLLHLPLKEEDWNIRFTIVR